MSAPWGPLPGPRRSWTNAIFTCLAPLLLNAAVVRSAPLTARSAGVDAAGRLLLDSGQQAPAPLPAAGLVRREVLAAGVEPVRPSAQEPCREAPGGVLAELEGPKDKKHQHVNKKARGHKHKKEEGEQPKEEQLAEEAPPDEELLNDRRLRLEQARLSTERFVLQKDAGEHCPPGQMHVMSMRDCVDASKMLKMTWNGGVKWRNHVSGCFALDDQGGKAGMFFNEAGQSLGQGGDGMAVCNSAKKDVANDDLDNAAYYVQTSSGPCDDGRPLRNWEQCEAAATALGKKWHTSSSMGFWKGHLKGCFEGQGGGYPTGVLHWNKIAHPGKQGLAVCTKDFPRFVVQTISAAACKQGTEPVGTAKECEQAAQALGKDWNAGSVDRWPDHVNGCFEGDLNGGLHNGRLHFNEGGQNAGPHGFVVCKGKTTASPSAPSEEKYLKAQTPPPKAASLLEEESGEEAPEREEEQDGNVSARTPAALLSANGVPNTMSLSKAEDQACTGAALNPPEWWRRYSSVEAYAGGRDEMFYKQSRLDGRSGAQAWCADKNHEGEWMQMYLHHIQLIKGTVVQGRPNSSLWVTKYRVENSTDGKTWDVVGEFEGNKDDASKQQNNFAAPVLARYVRIYPQSWHGHICMRAAVLGCKAYNFERIVQGWKDWDRKLKSEAEKLRKMRNASDNPPLEGWGHRRRRHLFGVANALAASSTSPPKTAEGGQQRAEGTAALPRAAGDPGEPERPGPPGEMGLPGPPGPPGETAAEPPIDCVWSEWESWTPCSSSCGRQGTRRRERDVKVFPQDHGRNCEGGSHELEPCNRVPCPTLAPELTEEPLHESEHHHGPTHELHHGSEHKLRHGRRGHAEVVVVPVPAATEPHAAPVAAAAAPAQPPAQAAEQPAAGAYPPVDAGPVPAG